MSMARVKYLYGWQVEPLDTYVDVYDTSHVCMYDRLSSYFYLFFMKTLLVFLDFWNLGGGLVFLYMS